MNTEKIGKQLNSFLEDQDMESGKWLLRNADSLTTVNPILCHFQAKKIANFDAIDALALQLLVYCNVSYEHMDQLGAVLGEILYKDVREEFCSLALQGMLRLLQLDCTACDASEEMLGVRLVQFWDNGDWAFVNRLMALECVVLLKCGVGEKMVEEVFSALDGLDEAYQVSWYERLVACLMRWVQFGNLEIQGYLVQNGVEVMERFFKAKSVAVRNCLVLLIKEMCRMDGFDAGGGVAKVLENSDWMPTLRQHVVLSNDLDSKLACYEMVQYFTQTKENVEAWIMTKLLRDVVKDFIRIEMENVRDVLCNVFKKWNKITLKKVQIELGENIVENFCTCLCVLGMSSIHVEAKKEIVFALELLAERSTVKKDLVKCVHLEGCLVMLHVVITAPCYEAIVLEKVESILIPKIRQHEKVYGSLLGLKEINPCFNSLQDGLLLSTPWQEKGKLMFQLGNIYAARVCYREALNLIRICAAISQRKLNASNDLAAWPESLSTGSYIKVKIESKYRSAMVADVDPDLHTVDVMYSTDDEEEDGVSINRVLLCLTRKDTELMNFHVLRILLNIAKCCRKLDLPQDAIDCLTDVLKIDDQHFDALYLRGILAMQIKNFELAKKDLWKANSLRKQHPFVKPAWTRLGALLKQKKFKDKKAMREMLQYVSSIPGINDVTS